MRPSISSGTLDNAIPLAGGQSLMPMLNFRVVAPDHLVDLNRIARCPTSRSRTAPALRRMTRQRDLELSSDVKARFPISTRRCSTSVIARPQSRTFGGSLCHLDPRQLVNMAVLHDGVLEAKAAAPRRAIQAGRLGRQHHDECARARRDPRGIELRTCRPARPRLRGVPRRHGDFAINGGRCLLTIEQRTIAGRRSVCRTGASTGRVAKAERLLVRTAPSHEAFRAAPSRPKHSTP